MTGMQFPEFLNRIIDEGKESARQSYGHRERDRDKLKGALSGFESCRGKGPAELLVHLQRCRESQGRASILQSRGNSYHSNGWSWYWWIACYVNEVVWVCEVVSAALYNQGMPTIISPTARSVLKAASILGTQSEGPVN